MRYGNCRWVDIQATDKDQVVVVVPTGALEQHGRHLPLLTDTILVTEVAERVEKKLSDQVLLVPTLWLGASDHHLDFPGTLSLPGTLYAEMIKHVLQCCVGAGFRRIMFLNGHGGNTAPGTVAITEMANSREDCDAVLVGWTGYWQGPAFAPEKHGMETPHASHACEYETSMMLAVADEMVQMSEARAGSVVIDSKFYHSELGGQVTLAGRFHRRTSTGAMGRPDLGTAEKGVSLIDAAVEDTVGLITDFLTWETPRVFSTEQS